MYFFLKRWFDYGWFGKEGDVSTERDALFSVVRNQLVRHEGVRLMPYKDQVGKWTIGIGRNLDDVGIYPEEKGKVPDDMTNGITEEQAFLMLKNDIDRCYAQCKEKIDFFDKAPFMIKVVLLNMCFNLGIAGLLKFSKTLLCMKEKKYKEASRNMLKSLWAEQVGKRAVELAGIVESEDKL
jgi:lysozyme